MARAGVRGMGTKDLTRFLATCEAVLRKAAPGSYARQIANEKLFLARAEIAHREIDRKKKEGTLSTTLKRWKEPKRG
jgi:hypothetical protein